MKISSLASSASLVALCLMLGACGGGGGIASTPTPPSSGGSGGTPTPSGTGGTPTPSGGGGTPTPTGTNSDLIAPLSSETFKNNAAYGSISVPTGAGTTTRAAGQLALTFSYNASNGTYTVSDGTVSQSFSSSDKDATQSDSVQTTYVKTSKTTGDTFSLVNTGTGAGQTRYVGAGFLQHQVNGSSSIDGRFDAFTYGVETANASMPHSGAASFDVNLLGAYSLYSTIYALGGTGTLNVDFSNGALDVSGFYSLVDLINGGGVQSGMGWRGFGMVTSGTNDFTGKLNFDNIGDASLNGLFYGPAADEVGAVFWAKRDADNNLVGALYGARGTYPVNQFGDVTYPANDSFFTPSANSVKATVDASGILSNPTTGTALKAILIRATNGQQLISYRNASQIYFPWRGANPSFSATYELTAAPVDYFQAGQQLVKDSGSVTLDTFLYGMDTASADMPRTGTAHYSLGLRAGILDPGSEIQTVIGFGDMLANFATGDIEADGNFQSYTYPPASGLGYGTPSPSLQTDSGTWTSTGAISSTGFAGNLTFDGTTYNASGPVHGQFYGPNADELGAIFTASDGGAQFSGYLTGTLSDSAYSGNSTLADLTAATDLSGIGVGVYEASSSSVLEYFATPQVSFDPSVGTYSFNVDYNYGTGFDQPWTLDLGPGDVDSSIAEPGFTHYTKGSASGEILDIGAGNPVIQLTYLTYAHFEAPVQDGGSPLDVHHYLIFGLPTSHSRVPQTGSASYSGLAYGWGKVHDTTGGLVYRSATVTGTSSMDFDFSNDTFSASLDLTATEVGTDTKHDLGTFDFTGTSFITSRNQFTADTGSPGTFSGQFFGPNAEEFGAGWTVGLFTGVAFGKKN